MHVNTENNYKCCPLIRSMFSRQTNAEKSLNIKGSLVGPLPAFPFHENEELKQKTYECDVDIFSLEKSCKMVRKCDAV